MARDYAGWDVPDVTLFSVNDLDAMEGVVLDGDQIVDHWGALLILSRDGKNIAILLEDHGSGYEVLAENDTIIPDGAEVGEKWWIQDNNWGHGTPYIWYMPTDAERGFYYQLGRDHDGIWKVMSGFFGDSDAHNENRLGFSHANRSTALRVYKWISSAVYVPIEVDMSFLGFDPEAVKAFCAEAMTLHDKPALVPSTMEADALPQGQAIAFEKGNAYPVYAGPGTEYLRLGEEQDATASSDDWIQVFGQENGWLLIQYNVSQGHNRFGYIQATLPEGVHVPALRFEPMAGVLHDGGGLTDDPLRTLQDIYTHWGFPAGTQCVQLATLGAEFPTEWAFVEITDPDQPKVRGFTPADGISFGIPDTDMLDDLDDRVDVEVIWTHTGLSP